MTVPLPHGRTRAEVVEDLRHSLPGMHAIPARPRIRPFELPAIDACLPQGGLSLQAVHEIAAATEADRPAALGFAAALLGRLPRGGPVVFIATRKNDARRASCGHSHSRQYTQPDDHDRLSARFHAHGLNSLGLDPARVIFVNAKDDKEALWASEETLRSGVPCAVVSTTDSQLDLRASQRLHLAAGDNGIPLFLLRPPDASGVNVAATRWRIRTAPALRDRFGFLARWRWRVRLERCRNGRTGEWLVEYDHGAYRFSLSASMADPAVSHRTNTCRTSA
jgi:protein ImuA